MDKPTGLDALTERQKQVLRLIARHMQEKEIARLLRISVPTVKDHAGQARRRLGASTSRMAAILLSEYEAQAAAIPDVGYTPGIVANPVPPVPSSGHGNEILPQRTLHDHPLPRTGSGMADVRRPQQDPSGGRGRPDGQDPEQHGGPGQGADDPGGGVGVADRVRAGASPEPGWGWGWISRWLHAVDQRLKDQALTQLMFRLGVTSVIATMVLCLMIVGIAGAMEILQGLVR